MSDGKQLTTMLAEQYNVEREQFISTVKATCFSGKQPSNEQFLQFLLVAKEYGLNPFIKEIYAFPTANGIQPIVGVDGWLKIINSHPQFDGMEFDDKLDDHGNIVAITCRMYRKDRGHATTATEYMAECKRNTPTWKQWPARMLRHKATIQAARMAFGFSGIADPDEGERIKAVTADEPSQVMQVIETHAYTTAQRDQFQELLAENDSLGMWHFSQHTPREAWIDLYNSAKKGNKVKQKATLDNMTGEGHLKQEDLYRAIDAGNEFDIQAIANEVTQYTREAYGLPDAEQ